MVSIVKNAFGLTAFRTLAVAFALLARYKIVPISVENEKEVNKTSGTFKNRQKFENHQRFSKNQNHVKITPIFRDTTFIHIFHVIPSIMQLAQKNCEQVSVLSL